MKKEHSKQKKFSWRAILIKVIKQGLIIAFISIIISFLAGEYIVKHIVPQQTYELAKLEGLHIFEESSSTPFTLQKNVKHSYHIGYTHEFDHYVSTNSWGTRGKEFQQKKPGDTYRILILGDSMTFGWGVEDDQTYATVLEKYLNKYSVSGKIKNFEIINAGFADGLSPDSYYVYLKENAPKLHPDLIIVNLFPYNDISDLLDNSWDHVDAQGYPLNISSRTQRVENHTLVNRQKTNWKFEIPVLRNYHLAILFFNAMERGSPQLVSSIKKILNITDKKEELSNDQQLACIYSLMPEKCYPSVLKNIEKTEFLLTGLAEFAATNNADFFVTIMPSPDQAIPLSQNADQKNLLSTAQPQKHFQEFLTGKKITYLDLLPTLSEQNAQSFYYLRDGHLTKGGHEQVAKELYTFITEKNTTK